MRFASVFCCIRQDALRRKTRAQLQVSISAGSYFFDPLLCVGRARNAGRNIRQRRKCVGILHIAVSPVRSGSFYGDGDPCHIQTPEHQKTAKTDGHRYSVKNAKNAAAKAESKADKKSDVKVVDLDESDKEEAYDYGDGEDETETPDGGKDE